MMRLAFPSLGHETQVVTFIVPTQTDIDQETGNVRNIPEQAVFAVVSPHPRATFEKLYQGKTLMTSAGLWRSVWDQDAKDRKHYATTMEDPAWKLVRIAARTHAEKIQSLKELN